MRDSNPRSRDQNPLPYRLANPHHRRNYTRIIQMTTKSSLLLENSTDAARHLLGCLLIRDIDGHHLVGRIVETEAYDQKDAASHSYRGITPRTEVMFGPPGHAYVYFTYGMHYCLNIVTGQDGYGAAVLIRAIEPISGIKYMKLNRTNTPDVKQLTNGPAKLCQALSIDKNLNGHDLTKAPLRLKFLPSINQDQIIQTTRIGISRDEHRPWRFYIKGNSFVSKLS